MDFSRKIQQRMKSQQLIKWSEPVGIKRSLLYLFQIINVVTAGLLSWFMMTDVASFGLLIQSFFCRAFLWLTDVQLQVFH